MPTYLCEVKASLIQIQILIAWIIAALGNLYANKRKKGGRKVLCFPLHSYMCYMHKTNSCANRVALSLSKY